MSRERFPSFKPIKFYFRIWPQVIFPNLFAKYNQNVNILIQLISVLNSRKYLQIQVWVKWLAVTLNMLHHSSLRTHIHSLLHYYCNNELIVYLPCPPPSLSKEPFGLLESNRNFYRWKIVNKRRWGKSMLLFCAFWW